MRWLQLCRGAAPLFSTTYIRLVLRINNEGVNHTHFFSQPLLQKQRFSKDLQFVKNFKKIPIKKLKQTLPQKNF